MHLKISDVEVSDSRRETPGEPFVTADGSPFYSEVLLRTSADICELAIQAPP